MAPGSLAIGKMLRFYLGDFIHVRRRDGLFHVKFGVSIPISMIHNGLEIALHSITHRTPQTFWAEADYESMRGEFADQRVLMSHFANIPLEKIQGMRMPFLQLAGNASFQVLKNAGMTYDASWPTITLTDPGLWPYTLDYASTQDCQLPPCPSASLEGVWVLPMVAWRDLNNNPCSMVDSCFSPYAIMVPNRLAALPCWMARLIR
ncbi:hypothetical protein evm_003249 [Chilo suppressalis]|nr:hypothetical protein evm_003249 [Chilo suppressalis]